MVRGRVLGHVVVFVCLQDLCRGSFSEIFQGGGILMFGILLELLSFGIFWIK